MSFWSPKSTISSFSPDLIIAFFWNCTWGHVLKNGLKWLFWIFLENYFFSLENYYFQNEVNGEFLGPNSSFFNFSQNLFIRFLWNCFWWQALKSGLKLLKKILFMLNLFIGLFWNCTRWYASKLDCSEFCRKINNMPKIGEMGLFLTWRSTLFIFYLNLFFRFFRCHTWWQALKK